MRYFLSCNHALKRLEFPAVYNIQQDELYELDEDAFEFLARCADGEGCESDHCDSEFLDYAAEEGILTRDRTEVRRPAVKRSPEPSLRYLELQITKRCNLRCRHCYIGPPVDAELPFKKIVGILSQFEEMQGLRLLITGGEPLLHRDFRSINDALPDFAFRKVLFTNGTLLRREFIEALNVEEIQISIDGLESGHDALRGKGTYKKALEAAEMALDEGLEVSVSTMVHSANLGDFEGMEELMRGMGIRDWTVDVPCVEGNLRDNPLFRLEPSVAGKYLGYGFGDGLHGGEEGCACGLHLASVTVDGRVARCAFYADRTVGSADEGLDACWRRIRPLRVDELACDCTVRDICRGGCRYRAELLGDPLGKDLYRCFALIKQP